MLVECDACHDSLFQAQSRSTDPMLPMEVALKHTSHNAYDAASVLKTDLKRKGHDADDAACRLAAHTAIPVSVEGWIETERP